jgi:hypothetical protein
MQYSLPIKHHQLPNDKSINLYLACAFLEGTNVSVGRAEKQFKFMAHPICHKVISVCSNQYGTQNQCTMGSLFWKIYRMNRLLQLELKWLIKTYATTTNKATSPFFTKLAGTQKTPTTN